VCREKRFIVRDNFSWDPSLASKSGVVLEQLQVEVDGMKAALTRWCKNHYGDAFVAWMHIKVIRVFVEAVLRYGLPVDFTAVFYKVHPHKDLDLLADLDKHLGSAASSKEEKDDDGEWRRISRVCPSQV
jgi:V-type H+-transporting ATPase subunit C